MTRTMLIVAMAAVVLAVAAPSSGNAQDAQTTDSPQLDQAAMEKMFAELARPGREHETFKDMVGKWKTQTKSYWANPAEPAVSEGTATFKLLMGGRYVQQDFKGEYDGKPYGGMGIFGYDKAKKKYVSVWIDNMGTGMMVSEGDYDEATKTMTEIAQVDSPMGKLRVRTVTKDKDRDKFVLTMFMQPAGADEREVMEITYTRL